MRLYPNPAASLFALRYTDDHSLSDLGEGLFPFICFEKISCCDPAVMTNALQEAVQVSGCSTVCLVLVLLSSFSESRRVDCCSLPALLMLQQEICSFQSEPPGSFQDIFSSRDYQSHRNSDGVIRMNGFIRGSNQ